MEEGKAEKTSLLRERLSRSSRSPLVYYSSLAVTSLVLLVTFVVNILSSLPNATEFGFANGTGNVSDEFYLQVTPAGWTFSIWGIIYTWQALWVVYSWTFICRSSTPRTVSWIAMLLYTFTNVNNIIWIYMWGNKLPQVSFPFSILMWLPLIAAASVQAVHIHHMTSLMDSGLWRIDLWIGRLLVINGIAIYASWLTAATILNLGIVLQYFLEASPVTASSIGAWLLTVEIVAYFALENTLLNKYTRYIFIVYPVFIWALSGILSAHWGVHDPNSNPMITLLLLLLVITFFILRIIKWIYYIVKYWRSTGYTLMEK